VIYFDIVEIAQRAQFIVVVLIEESLGSKEPAANQGLEN
jgi:hypothetical protein